MIPMCDRPIGRQTPASVPTRPHASPRAGASEALRGTLPAGAPRADNHRARDPAAGSARPAPPWWRRWPEWVGYATAGWSLLYGALGLYWATGGAGFPFGSGHDPNASLSVLAGARPEVAAPSIGALGLIGAVVAIAAARTWGRGTGRAALLAFAWALAAGLALVIPDARVLAVMGYAPMILVGAPFGW